jgi:excisionase family DNA binding protein
MQKHRQGVSPLWKSDDVAEYISVSPAHVRRLVSQGKIPSFKIGRSRRFNPLVIQEWVRAQETGDSDTATF